MTIYINSHERGRPIVGRATCTVADAPSPCIAPEALLQKLVFRGNKIVCEAQMESRSDERKQQS